MWKMLAHVDRHLCENADEGGMGVAIAEPAGIAVAIAKAWAFWEAVSFTAWVVHISYCPPEWFTTVDIRFSEL